MNFLPFEQKLLTIVWFVATLVVTGDTNVATFCESDPLTNIVLIQMSHHQNLVLSGLYWVFQDLEYALTLKYPN